MLSLNLTNFGCHENLELTLPEKGLVLISGPSGIGKSTIFKAINFVLYDRGTKIITAGKTSCKVILKHLGVVITRTKRPNRVVLIKGENEYEDDAAESIIQEIYGKHFETTSYIEQNSRYSFVNMTPLEKLTFLQTFGLNEINLEELKKCCSKELAEANETLVSMSSKLTILESENVRKIKPCRVPKVSENYFESDIQRVESEQKKLTENITQLRIMESKIEQAEERLDSLLNIQKSLILPVFSENELKTSKKELEQFIESSKLVREIEENEKLKSKIVEMEKEELLNFRKKETENLEIVSKLESLDKNKINELLTKIKSIENYTDAMGEASLVGITNIEEFDILSEKKLLQEYEKQKTELAYSVLTCPECSTELKLVDEKLVKRKVQTLSTCDTENLTDMTVITKKIKQLRNKISVHERVSKVQKATGNINELRKSLRELTEKFTILENAQNELKIPFKLSTSLFRMKRECEKETERLQEVERLQKMNVKSISLSKNVSLSVLTKKVSDLEEQKREYNSISSKIREISKSIEECEKILNKKNVVREDLVNLKKKFTDNEDLVQIMRKNIQEYSQYFQYKKERELYNEWKTHRNEITDCENIARIRYTALSRLREKISEAESISLGNVITFLNSAAQEFLDSFFNDNPMVARLTAFKELKSKKKTKPCVNLQIDYKGLDIEVSMLSGGELSRVILAFTLALSEISNSPLIMLDECTASLDSETNSKVMETLKGKFPNSLILVIGHQVVEGDFDFAVTIG